MEAPVRWGWNCTGVSWETENFPVVPSSWASHCSCCGSVVRTGDGNPVMTRAVCLCLSVREEPSLCLWLSFPASLKEDLSLSTAQMNWVLLKRLFPSLSASQWDVWRWTCGGWAEGRPHRCSTWGTNARGTHNLFCEHLRYGQAWWQCWPGSGGGHSRLCGIIFEHPCLLWALLSPSAAIIAFQTGSHDSLGHFHTPVGFGTAARTKREVKPLVAHLSGLVQDSPPLVLPKTGRGLCSLRAGCWHERRWQSGDWSHPSPATVRAAPSPSNRPATEGGTSKKRFF